MRHTHRPMSSSNVQYRLDVQGDNVLKLRGQVLDVNNKSNASGERLGLVRKLCRRNKRRRRTRALCLLLGRRVRQNQCQNKFHVLLPEVENLSTQSRPVMWHSRLTGRRCLLVNSFTQYVKQFKVCSGRRRRGHDSETFRFASRTAMCATKCARSIFDPLHASPFARATFSSKSIRTCKRFALAERRRHCALVR